MFEFNWGTTKNLVVQLIFSGVSNGDIQSLNLASPNLWIIKVKSFLNGKPKVLNMKESEQYKIKSDIECTTYWDRFSSIEPLAKFWDLIIIPTRQLITQIFLLLTFLKLKNKKKDFISL